MANQQALELQIAKRMATENPETAVEIGRRSLAQGFSNDLLSLLTKLQRKHQDQASVLYKEVVSELENKNLTKDWSARPFAVMLARSYVPNAVDESAYRVLIDKLVNTAFTTGCNKNVSDNYERGQVCSDIGSLLSAIEKIDPQRASQLKRWERQIYGWERTPQAYRELNEVVNKGSVDDVLALALDYPEIKRDIYWQGVTKALSAGDSAKARQIANDYKENPEVSRDLLALIDSRQNLFTKSVPNFEETQKTLGTIPRLCDQVQYLMYIAGEVGRDNRTLALELLDQSNGLAVMMNPGKDQTEAQIALA
jgi:hypothetical protein